MPWAENGPIHGIVTRGKGKVDTQLIRACKELQVIARCGVGLDNVDVAEATQQGIAVINAPGVNTATVAEHTLSLMLLLVRNLIPAIQASRNGQWDLRSQLPTDEIRGKTLGILGMGNIGKAVANLAAAFGMQVCYWDPYVQTDAYKQLPLPQLLAQAQVISIHLPLVPDTHRLINPQTLSHIQPRTYLINCARGPIVDTKAILESLEKGQLAAYAADVWDPEPPQPGDPLLLHPQVWVTPHNASLTTRTYEMMCQVSVEQVIRKLQGLPIEAPYWFNQQAIEDDDE